MIYIHHVFAGMFTNNFKIIQSCNDSPENSGSESY